MPSQPIDIAAEDLSALVARLFVAAGLGEAEAQRVAQGLVDADLEGLPSHGVMLTDMYLDRLRAGSISTKSAGDIVSDSGAAVVIDGCHAFGHLLGDQAMHLAVARARAWRRDRRGQARLSLRRSGALRAPCGGE
jgi:LDH2 family malate/lactate/ureidoglycolate dehydrogenase